MKLIYLQGILLLSVCLNANAQEWQWQNPSPVGNSHSDVAWIDDQTFYVSGIKGQFVKTSDFGQTWELAPVPTAAGLEEIYFVNASKGWAATDNGEIWLTEDAGTTWTLQHEELTAPTLRGIEVLDQVGYAGGDLGFTGNILLKTENGGADWSTVDLPVRPGAFFYGIFFTKTVNADTVYAASYDNIFFKSYDRGTTWDTIPLPESEAGYYEGGYFVNDSTGFIVGPNGYLVKTSDYGDTWAVLTGSADSTDEVSHYLTEVFFEDEQTGWMSSFGCLYKTIDGGSSWTRSCEGTYGTTRKSFIQFNEQGEGIIVAASEVFTTDNGSDFDVILPDGPTNTLYSIQKVESNLYIAASGGKVLQSDDNGQNWSVMDTPVTSTLTALRFTDQNNAWAAGRDSTVLKTTDAGMNWESFDLEFDGDFEDMYAWSASSAIVVGDAGAIYKTSDAGATWDKGNIMTEDGIQAVHFTDADTGYVAGTDGLLARTTDGGMNWTVLDTVVVSDLNDIYFTAGNRGYAVGSSGKILFTEDAGDTWAEQVSGESGTLNAVFFSSENQGYVTARGKVLLTDDGGQTWSTQDTPSGNALRDVYYDEEGNGWLVGSSGNILFSEGTVTSIDDMAIIKNKTRVFPNPADIKTTFALPNGFHGRAKLLLYDAAGNPILGTSLEFQDGRAAWDILPDVPAGLYYFRLLIPGRSMNGKLLIQK